MRIRLSSFARRTKEAAYTELPSSESLPDPFAASKASPLQQFIPWTIYTLAIACSALNIFFVIFFVTKLPPRAFDVGSTSQPVNLESLPRPNPYPGLERVLRPSTNSPAPVITNWPSLLAPVDSANPKFVYPDDAHRHFTAVGTISPRDKHFLLNEKVQSIVQFRVRDFGMENCSLRITVPDPDETGFLSDSTSNHSRSSDLQTPREVSIEVWSLVPQPHPIGARTLSWNTRPEDEGRLDILSVSAGNSSLSRTFQCPARSLQTFRLTCVSAGCNVDLWQADNLGRYGVTMMQRPSI